MLQPWRDTGLVVLPAGQIPPNPSELLGSKAMASLLKEMTAKFDMVLIDSPPILPVTDAAILGRMVGGTLLVVDTGRLHKAQLRAAMESLTTAGATVAGIVLNKVARKTFGHYGYGYSTGMATGTARRSNRSLPASVPASEREEEPTRLVGKL